MKEDNRKPWSVKLLQGAEMVLSASGMWGWLMLARSSSAPVTQLKWGLQSPPGRITGPHLCRGGVTRLAVLWGFASRSGKEDGLREREGCPREPGLQAGEDPWLQMRLAAVAGAPAQAAAAVLRMPHGERGSVRGLKGPIHGSQAHSGIPATQLGHAIHLSHSTLPPEWGSPRAYRLRGRHGFESTRASATAFGGFSARATRGGTKRIQCSPTRQTAMAWGVQQCEGIKSEKTAGRKEP